MSEEGGSGPAEGVTVEVPATLSGVRLDRGVAMVADVSRAVAAELVDAGRVFVDGAPVTSGRVPLREGALLTVQLPEEAPAAPGAEPAVRFSVVHADDDVAVIDKPAGLVVHPGAGHTEGTLVGGLLAVFPDLADLVTAGVCAAGPARHRAPARQGHLGTAGGRPHRRRVPVAREPAGHPEHGAQLPAHWSRGS